MKALLIVAVVLSANLVQAKEEKPCPFRNNSRLTDNTTFNVATSRSSHQQAPAGTTDKTRAGRH